MDTNLVVLGGRIAAEPDLRFFDSGGTLLRCLITVRSDEPERRLDVIPVARWNPTEAERRLEPGDSVWVLGTAQRRFRSGPEGRHSSVEIIASAVTTRTHDSGWE
jgi:single-stranded DNA-binding protein